MIFISKRRMRLYQVTFFHYRKRPQIFDSSSAIRFLQKSVKKVQHVLVYDLAVKFLKNQKRFSCFRHQFYWKLNSSFATWIAMPIKANIPRTVCAITFNFLEQHNFHRLSFSPIIFSFFHWISTTTVSRLTCRILFIFVSFSVANIFFSLPTASQKLMTNCSNLLPRLMWNETLVVAYIECISLRWRFFRGIAKNPAWTFRHDFYESEALQLHSSSF